MFEKAVQFQNVKHIANQFLTKPQQSQIKIFFFFFFLYAELWYD